MASAKSTGMDVNSDFTPKDTITSSWPIEYCLSSCKNSELFLTVGSKWLRQDWNKMFWYNISWTAYTACNRPQRSFRFVNFGETIERCWHSASVVGPQIGKGKGKSWQLEESKWANCNLSKVSCFLISVVLVLWLCEPCFIQLQFPMSRLLSIDCFTSKKNWEKDFYDFRQRQL